MKSAPVIATPTGPRSQMMASPLSESETTSTMTYWPYRLERYHADECLGRCRCLKAQSLHLLRPLASAESRGSARGGSNNRGVHSACTAHSW